MAWVLSHALARADVDETHAIFGQARILLKEGDITDAEGAGVTNTRRAIDITIKVGFCTRALLLPHSEPKLKIGSISYSFIHSSLDNLLIKFSMERYFFMHMLIY